MLEINRRQIDMVFRGGVQRVISCAFKTGSSALFFSRTKCTNPAIVNWSVKNSNVLPFLLGLGLGVLPGFPAVSALSWKKTTDEKDKPDVAGEGTIKMRNKNTELLKDIQTADRTYVVDEGISQDAVYEMLNRHKGKEEPELLWRLARITYELSKKARTKEDKEKLIHEAFATIQKALELDEHNFAVHKWMAILLNARSTLLGTKEQITQSYNVRKHMEVDDRFLNLQRAAELNPKDATSIYLLGNWCYTVAEIPWYQKKIASTIFATPPSCSFAEAAQHFLRAEATEPRFYSMNLLMLAKSFLKLGDPEKAEVYLLQLKSMVAVTDEDHQARQEGRELLDTIQKSRKT